MPATPRRSKPKHLSHTERVWLAAAGAATIVAAIVQILIEGHA